MKRVLLIEDELAYRNALSLKLEHEGFEVVVLEDGEEALGLLSGAEKFDLVVSDLMMPKKNGYAVLEYMQSEQPDVPVIVLSNLRQVEDVDKVKSFGAKDFISKADSSIKEVVSRLVSQI